MPVTCRPQCSLPRSWRSECSALQVSSACADVQCHSPRLHAFSRHQRCSALHAVVCGSDANVAQSLCVKGISWSFVSPLQATYVTTYLPPFPPPLAVPWSPPPPPVCDECRVIGVVSSLSLPVWGTDCNPCLMDYVPLVHRGLQDKVQACTHAHCTVQGATVDSRMRCDVHFCLCGVVEILLGMRVCPPPVHRWTLSIGPLRHVGSMLPCG